MRTTLGTTEFFTGPMSTAITRKVKMIRIISDAVFTTLTMQWPEGTSGNGTVAGSTLTFLAAARYEIEDVAVFKLLSGSIQVIYSNNG